MLTDEKLMKLMRAVNEDLDALYQILLCMYDLKPEKAKEVLRKFELKYHGVF